MVKISVKNVLMVDNHSFSTKKENINKDLYSTSKEEECQRQPVKEHMKKLLNLLLLEDRETLSKDSKLAYSLIWIEQD